MLKIPSIYVSNLPWTVNHLDLEKYFSKFGRVVHSKVIFNKSTGLSKGYGFIKFHKQESVPNVLKQNHYLEGKTLITKQN